MSDVPVDDVLELLDPDPDRLAKGRERMVKVWRNEEPDHLPLLAGGATVPEREQFPHYTLEEQFSDKEKMLVGHLWGMISVARGIGDAQPTLRANFGVGFIPSLFGLKSTFTQPDQMPWVVGPLPQERIERLDVPDVRKAGLMPRFLEFVSYFKEKLDGKGRVYLSDTQGPFDIAHLLRGHQIYYDVYDHPEFVHHLMEVVTITYIEASKIMKEAIGEPLNAGYHGGMYMENGGVRVCDDSSINLSEEQYRTFVQPYMERALEPFGGGWYHFCGNGKHILNAILDIPHVRGINLGNPKMYDFGEVLPKVLKRGKFYAGVIPADPDEDASAYVDRVTGYLDGARSGLILHNIAVGPDETIEEAVAIWRKAA